MPIDLFTRLIKDAGRNGFLILGNLKTHQARKVKALPADDDEKIEVFHLPSYSLELSLDDCVDADRKDGMM